MTPEQWTRLPKVFQEKIEIDKELSQFKQADVLNFEKGRNILMRRLTSRYRCEQFLRKNKRTDLGDNLA